MMDWKDTLKNLQTSGTLPEGPETLLETPAEEKPQTHKGKLHIAIEKKGRGGKTATIIYGFNGSDEELQELASTLRHRLGTGRRDSVARRQAAADRRAASQPGI